VTVGIFYETIGTKLIWFIFNHQSIGLMRFLDICLILILKILLVSLSFKITQLLNINNFYKNLFFVINSCICINIIDYNISSVDLLSFREIPIVLSLILFITFLQNEKKRIYLLILFGSLSVLTIFWSLDRGIVYNLLILIFALYLLFIKENKKFLILIGSIIFFWIFFFFFLENEFQYFVSNSLSILKDMSYVHGIIHPTPFSEDPNSYRASKTLISIILVLIISINLFLDINKKFSLNLKVFLFFFAVITFLSYAYVVGRSDGPHIKNIFGYPLIFFSFYFSYSLLYYFESKFDLKTFNLSKYFLLLIIIIFFFSNIFIINFDKIKNYPERLSEYIYFPDNRFLGEKELIFIEKSKPIVKEHSCVQLFSNDAALLYLLKKKSCSKFYFIWSVGSLSNQKVLINEIKNTNMIVSRGPTFNWDLPISEKLPLVNNYIENNYFKVMSIEDWDIYNKN
ncbi:hypothetical protein OAP10_03720, partial [Candidatus Pelagibacter sp.]|nr:hypothetical protein [Candidatus Pelagibacter sp.]